MRVKTSELIPPALDWVLSTIEGVGPGMSVDSWLRSYSFRAWRYSTDWSQGGPIIEREKISVTLKHHGWWAACIYNVNDDPQYGQIGPTALIAAMRCKVATTLGDEVDVPEELL